MEVQNLGSGRADYEYVWSYDLENRKPVSTPRRVPCTERQLTLSIHAFDFETSAGRVNRYLSYSGNSSQDCPFVCGTWAFGTVANAGEF